MAWGYAAAGLGEGALKGFLLGSEIAERRRRAKQEQEREQLMMLYPAIKQNPKLLKELEPLFQKTWGPQFKVPDVPSPFEQQKAEVEQAMPWFQKLAPGMSAEDRLKLAMGYAPSKVQPPVEAIPYDPANPPSGQFQGRPRFFPVKQAPQPVQAIPYDPENPPSGQFQGRPRFFPIKQPGSVKLPKGPDIEKQVDNLLKKNPFYDIAPPEERMKMRNDVKAMIMGGAGTPQDTPWGEKEPKKEDAEKKVKAKAKELIDQGEDPDQVKKWAASKGVKL